MHTIKELDYPSFTLAAYRRISWGAVFGGAITSLAVLTALTSLGAGLGWATARMPGQALLQSLGTEGVLWMLASGIASFYAGGWVAGRLTDIARVSESVIHGLVSWSVATAALTLVFIQATVGVFGVIAIAVGAMEGLSAAVFAPDVLTAATRAGNLGIAGGLAFLTLACGAAAAGLGARAGTRVLRPVPAPETRRERAVP